MENNYEAAIYVQNINVFIKFDECKNGFGNSTHGFNDLNH